MKHPNIGDLVRIKFAGMTRTGRVTEISGSGLDKKWVVLAQGVYYPCLVLDTGKMHHIIEYVKDDIDTTRTCSSGE
jgi:hypothetical protein